MSFLEKKAWASLVTTVLVFVPYFLNVYRLFVADELEAGAVIGLFIGAVVLQIVLQIAIHIGFALLTSAEQRTDERDSAIESKSIRYASVIYSAASMMWILVILFLASAPETPQRLLAPVWLSQTLLACFVIAEVAKYLLQAISYRRGV